MRDGNQRRELRARCDGGSGMVLAPSETSRRGVCEMSWACQAEQGGSVAGVAATNLREQPFRERLERKLDRLERRRVARLDRLCASDPRDTQRCTVPSRLVIFLVERASVERGAAEDGI